MAAMQRTIRGLASLPKRTYGIGLLGYGVVGSHVAKLLKPAPNLTRRLPENVGLALKSVARRTPGPLKDFPHISVSTDPVSIARNPGTDILVEVIGGLLPAGEAIATALEAGKPVVTANKALLATHPELFTLARERRVPLLFEASVGGGIPVVEFVRTQLSGAEVGRITGVLNGSTNYILEKLNSGESMGDAMDEARSLGYLEADPSDDISGRDAGYKISILHALAFPVKFAERSVRGIGGLERPPKGKRWRLLCRATSHSVSVSPELVGPDSPFWNLPGSTNAVLLETDVGDYCLTGPGAGGMPTASAVVGDIIRCVDWLEGGQRKVEVPWFPNLTP